MHLRVLCEGVVLQDMIYIDHCIVYNVDDQMISYLREGHMQWSRSVSLYAKAGIILVAVWVNMFNILKNIWKKYVSVNKQKCESMDFKKAWMTQFVIPRSLGRNCSPPVCCRRSEKIFHFFPTSL